MRTLYVIVVRNRKSEISGTCLEVWEGTPPADSPWELADKSSPAAKLRPIQRRCVECFVNASCASTCCKVSNSQCQNVCHSSRAEDSWKGCQSQLGVNGKVQQVMTDHLNKNGSAHGALRHPAAHCLLATIEFC